MDMTFVEMVYLVAKVLGATAFVIALVAVAIISIHDLFVLVTNKRRR